MLQLFVACSTNADAANGGCGAAGGSCSCLEAAKWGFACCECGESQTAVWLLKSQFKVCECKQDSDGRDIYK
jgi:hypothetical protein